MTSQHTADYPTLQEVLRLPVFACCTVCGGAAGQWHIRLLLLHLRIKFAGFIHYNTTNINDVLTALKTHQHFSLRQKDHANQHYRGRATIRRSQQINQYNSVACLDSSYFIFILYRNLSRMQMNLFYLAMFVFYVIAKYRGY